MWIRLTAVVLISGCGSPTLGPTLAIDPPKAAIGPKDWITFRATGSLANGRTFHWAISPPGPTLMQDGRLFAALAPGTYVVTATSETLSATSNLIIYDDLVDGSGPILAQSKIHALWWGDPAAFPSDAKAAIEKMLSDLNSSLYFGNVAEYMRGATPQTSFLGSVTDSWSTPPTDPSAIEQPGAPLISRELCSVLAREGIEPDRNSIYVVYGSTFPTGATWTGFHEWSSCSTVVAPDEVAFPIAYVPVPDEAHLPGVIGQCNSLSAATTGMLNVTAHEVMESITNPAVNVFEAWRSPKFMEIADKCSGLINMACVRIGPQDYFLQGLYSDLVHGCVH
jgi:hypothetical protein